MNLILDKRLHQMYATSLTWHHAISIQNANLSMPLPEQKDEEVRSLDLVQALHELIVHRKALELNSGNQTTFNDALAFFKEHPLHDEVDDV